MSRPSPSTSVHAPTTTHSQQRAALVAALLALAVAAAVAIVLATGGSSGASSEPLSVPASHGGRAQVAPAFVSHPEEGTRGPTAVALGRPDGGPDEGTRGPGH